MPPHHRFRCDEDERSQPDHALTTWDQAYAINRLIDGKTRYGYYTIQSLCNLGAANIEYGYLRLAEQYLQEGLQGSKAMGDIDHQGRLKRYLGLVHHLRANLTEAVKIYDAALDMSRGKNSRGLAVFLLHRTRP